MTDNILIDLSIEFAVNIVNWCDGIKGKSVLTNQLIRSGTSIGANIHEGNYANSRADFVAKFQIALKECFETEYWLEIFYRTNIIKKTKPKTFVTPFVLLILFHLTKSITNTRLHNTKIITVTIMDR